MRFLYPLLLPSLTQALAIRASDFVCPEEDIAATGCLGPKDCLYPNPDGCNTFIQCTVNEDGVTGTPVVMPCPHGLEWNDNTKQCDYPENSTCGNSAIVIQVEETIASHFVCPKEDIANTNCLGPKDCLYPNPDSCNTFIQCTVNEDGITGTPVVMPCPHGLEWNDDTKQCDYPANSTCPNKTIVIQDGEL